MKNKNQNIVAERIAALEKVLLEKDLDMILICSSLEEFGFGFAVSGIRPIYHHYFFLMREKFLAADSHGKATKGEKIVKGYFVPSFLVERLGLKQKKRVITFGDKDITKDMRKFLTGAKRVGIIGPAPAVDFSRSRAELVFLDDQTWPILEKKSQEEIQKIREVSTILNNALQEAKSKIETGERMDKLAESLDKKILTEADDLAFPSLVESRQGNKHILYLLGNRAKIRNKDLLYLNVGAQKDGFFADAGRTFVVNNPGLEKIYKQFEKAYLTFIKALKPGMKLADLPELLQEYLQKSGLEKIKLRDSYIGHSIGFSIINLPFIGKELFPDERLKDETVWSMVVECSVDGQYFQVQDTILVGQKGNEILSR